MVDIAPELNALLEEAARARNYFSAYTAFVHDWECRSHQRRAYSALQAIAEGRLIANGHVLCNACRDVEARWIAEEQLPYETGFRVSKNCKVCPTTNKLLWLAFFASGKTDTLIEWVAWMIGRTIQDGGTPQCGWLSYADGVADLRSVAIRDTIEFNKRYQFVFPDAKPDRKKGYAEGEWFLKRADPGEKDPTMRASGIFGSILSYRFGTLGVIDDPQDPAEVRGETYRDTTWNQVANVFVGRTNESLTPIVCVANRWWEDDIPGRLMALRKDWRVLITPALNEESDETVFPPGTWHGKAVGKSTKSLHDMREDDHLTFLMSYMCKAPSTQSEIFTYLAQDPLPSKDAVVRCVQFWDTATTTKTSSDPSAMSEKWKLKNGRACTAKIINKKMGPTELINTMMAEYKRAENEGLTPVIVIENAHAGPAFHAQLRAAGYRSRLHDIGGFGKGKGRRGQLDLVSRANGVIGQYAGGVCFFPNGSVVEYPWKETAFAQLRAFDKGQHDDIVAAEIGATEFLYPHMRRGRPQRTFEMVRTY